MLSPFNLFVKVKVWYPMKEKVGSEFYKSVPKYYRIYDTFQMLDAPGAHTSGGKGAPGGGAADAASISEMENKTENEEIPVIGWGNDVEGEVDISAC